MASIVRGLAIDAYNQQIQEEGNLKWKAGRQKLYDNRPEVTERAFFEFKRDSPTQAAQFLDFDDLKRWNQRVAENYRLSASEFFERQARKAKQDAGAQGGSDLDQNRDAGPEESIIQPKEGFMKKAWHRIKNQK
ncbi:hypothetical protein BP5796_12661 [Coleophoma crateriformis]|uniref:Uncharacterized protein n=1 Tax=Coleophoma crateriformis TaxID=565419 RepID=A0A3D8Q5W7_9HELO|nr:hypothetical protein BP5796_12661 [Coleophoma crateriformis]